MARIEYSSSAGRRVLQRLVRAAQSRAAFEIRGARESKMTWYCIEIRPGDSLESLKAQLEALPKTRFQKIGAMAHFMPVTSKGDKIALRIPVSCSDEESVIRDWSQ
jgi:hypothetical protein